MVLSVRAAASPRSGRAALVGAALAAVSQGAATKGTLEAGKLADLVILGADPLDLPPRTIKDTPMRQSVKAGRVVWRAER